MNRRLNLIKDVLADNIGSRVELQTNRGRRRVRVSHGVLIETYPTIFTVQVDQGRKVSYNYADVLTDTVIVTLDDKQLNNLS